MQLKQVSGIFHAVSDFSWLSIRSQNNNDCDDDNIIMIDISLIYQSMADKGCLFV